MVSVTDHPARVIVRPSAVLVLEEHERILQKAGFRAAGWREHDLLGDLQVFERVSVPMGVSLPRRFVERQGSMQG